MSDLLQDAGESTVILETTDGLVSPWNAARLFQYLYTNQYEVRLPDEEDEKEEAIDAEAINRRFESIVVMYRAKLIPLSKLLQNVKGYLTEEVKQVEAARDAFEIDKEMWDIAHYYGIVSLKEYIASKYTKQLWGMFGQTRGAQWQFFLKALSMMVGSFHELPKATENMCNMLMVLRFSGKNHEVNYLKSLFDTRNTSHDASMDGSEPWKFPGKRDGRLPDRTSKSTSPRKRKRAPRQSLFENETDQESDLDSRFTVIQASLTTTGPVRNDPVSDDQDTAEEEDDSYVGPSLQDLLDQDAHFTRHLLDMMEKAFGPDLANAWTTRFELCSAIFDTRPMPRHV